MARRLWIPAAVLILGAALGWALFGRSDDASTTSPPASNTTTPNAESDGREPTPAMRAMPALDRGLVADDPTTDGWDSEAFAQRTDRVWYAIATALTAGPVDVDALDAIVSDECSTTPFVPANPTTAFRSRSIEVDRGTLGADVRTGRDALRSALNRGRASLGADSIRVKFKTVDVAPIETDRETLVRVEMYGEHPDGGVQQRMHWRCRWSSTAQPQLRSIVALDWERARVRAPQRVLFADCTLAAIGTDPAFASQLRFGSEDWMSRVDAVLSVETYGHHGIAVADVDGDGLEDVHVSQPWGLPNRLFRQNADGTATDIARAAGLDWLEPSYGALFVDIDNDRDADLVVATNAELSVFENDGRGRFERRATLPVHGAAMSLAAADPDGDGDLDLYACLYYPRSMKTGQLAQPVPYHDANNGGRNVFWRNVGRFRFEDATDAVGLGRNNTRWSFAAAWADYDDDGDQDLYVANDFGRNNLYRNDGGRFTDVAAAAGVEDMSFGMAASWGDYDRDGDLDLHVANMFSAAGHRVTSQRRFKRDASDDDRARIRYLARGNSLFANRGDGTFEDRSAAAGIGMGRWSWSSIHVDVNNDGWSDLLVANGFLTNERTDDL